MPRAYWMEPNKFVMPPTQKLCSSMILLTPSEATFQIIDWLSTHRGLNDYDMEIVNNLYQDSALILPHRRYDLLTGEFKSDKHAAYLGSSEEVWDPDKALKEAKFLHFSDWPVPKVISLFVCLLLLMS